MVKRAFCIGKSSAGESSRLSNMYRYIMMHDPHDALLVRTKRSNYDPLPIVEDEETDLDYATVNVFRNELSCSTCDEYGRIRLTPFPFSSPILAPSPIPSPSPSSAALPRDQLQLLRPSESSRRAGSSTAPSKSRNRSDNFVSCSVD
jgi:hypothetical protein